MIIYCNEKLEEENNEEKREEIIKYKKEAEIFIISLVEDDKKTNENKNHNYMEDSKHHQEIGSGVEYEKDIEDKEDVFVSSDINLKVQNSNDEQILLDVIDNQGPRNDVKQDNIVDNQEDQEEDDDNECKSIVLNQNSSNKSDKDENINLEGEDVNQGQIEEVEPQVIDKEPELNKQSFASKFKRSLSCHEDYIQIQLEQQQALPAKKKRSINSYLISGKENKILQQNLLCYLNNKDQIKVEEYSTKWDM